MRTLENKDTRKKKEEEEEEVKTCWAYMRGECTKGELCLYSHENGAGSYGTCFEFKQGNCTRGSDCRFSHPGEEPSDNAETRKEKKKMERENGPRVCYAYQNGKCHRGKACRFLHDKIPMPVPETDTEESNRKNTRSNRNTKESVVVAKESEETVAELITMAVENDAQLKDLYQAEQAAKKAYEAVRLARGAYELKAAQAKEVSDTTTTVKTTTEVVRSSPPVRSSPSTSVRSSTPAVRVQPRTRPPGLSSQRPGYPNAPAPFRKPSQREFNARPIGGFVDRPKKPTVAKVSIKDQRKMKKLAKKEALTRLQGKEIVLT